MEFEKTVLERVNWIKEILAEAGAKGIVLGMSGGKDSALVGILCRMATPNVTGIIMPCGYYINYRTPSSDSSSVFSYWLSDLGRCKV